MPSIARRKHDKTIPEVKALNATGETSLERRFRRLVLQWKAQTAYMSSLTDMTEHPAYHEIIRLGEDVVPLLLEELEREPNHWFVALRRITGANPVPPESRGKVIAMAKAWLEWGREHGYSW